MKNNRVADTVELEAELIRLNTLVRARRKQLARLQRCPHKDCECRMVWRDVVEKNLAQQMGKIRQQVTRKPAKKTSTRRVSRSKAR